MGHRWVNVFWLSLTHGVVTITDVQALADGIKNAWDANLKAQVPSTVIMTSVDVVYFPTSSTEIRYTGSYSITGTAAGTITNDAAACYVIDLTISSFYRGGHPRHYLPGVLTSAITNGSDITPSVASGVAAAYNTYRNAINALTSANITATVMGTLRYVSAHAWLTPPVFWAFTSTKAGNGNKLGSQRRRIKS